LASGKIAMVAAMEREVRPLVRDWRVSEREVSGRRYSFLESDDAVLVCGGIGADAARRAAEAIISLYAPRMIYSAGFAGALDSKMKVGDVLRPARVVNAGDGSSVAIAGGDGVLVSFGSVASPEQKRKLRESFVASAVDMEAAAVARAAEARGVAFGVVKAISDEADFVFPSMERFVDAEGRFHDGRFAVFAAARPWLWGKVMRLATNSGIASRALCAALEKIAADAGPAGSPVLEAATKR
jgi:adenosylhomocysteine nucleosidase